MTGSQGETGSVSVYSLEFPVIGINKMKMREFMSLVKGIIVRFL